MEKKYSEGVANKCVFHTQDVVIYRLLNKSQDPAMRGNLQFFSKGPLIFLDQNTRVQGKVPAAE